MNAVQARPCDEAPARRVADEVCSRCGRIELALFNSFQERSMRAA